MFQGQASAKQNCSLLAVLCGRSSEKKKGEVKHRPAYPFPELVSSGRLEVHKLINPTVDKFREAQRLLEPSFFYFQGELLDNEEEIGSLVWGNVDVSDPQSLCSLIGPLLPTIIYLEVPRGELIAQALHAKGVSYVIYWKNAFSSQEAAHFRQALLSVVQSSCSHTWDAFQVAHASFRLYCLRNNHVFPENKQTVNVKLGPHLLGDAPKIDIPLRENDMDEEEGSSDGLPAIKIYDDDVDVKFLVCGLSCTLDACLSECLEDGLNALLNIEIRGSKLHNRVSATPPPLQAGTFSRGVVTMRCDITTCSSGHISLLVSGSAQTCFDDQLLECHIKNELIEKSRLVHTLPSCEKNMSSPEPLNFVSIAGGAPVFEVGMKVPTWAVEVLKQLAPEFSYRSLVMLGITSVHGRSVASFEKDDADRLLFFSQKQANDMNMETGFLRHPPRWFCSPIKKRPRPGLESESSTSIHNGIVHPSIGRDEGKEKRFTEVSRRTVFASRRNGLKVAALRPVPHCRQHGMLPFSGMTELDLHNGSVMKPNLPPVIPVKHNMLPPAPATHKKSLSSSSQAQQIISLNPLPMKKHGCNRSPIEACSEEEFLKDVMQFLILRGHSRLVPQGGISEFPDAILNAKRLDLYNLYREVVSRGGFYVGNGINWKGQVFSKMRNHTATNRMTGVGNTLKRHYETYLLEYELAHDDVDGECCLLCHSSAPGDWVNCGLCGEWAHFGCDRRQGLGTFKDYAKTDGLEYICPHCSLTNYKRKSQKLVNGFSRSSQVLGQV